MSEIKKLITQGEGRKLEFKESLPSNEKIIKTAVAFSNSQGGKLVIGIGNDKKIVGIDEDFAVEMEENISNVIYDNCVPNIMPEIYTLRKKKKTLLIVNFYPSSQKPHYVKKLGRPKGIYVRVGSTNKLATQDIVQNLERKKGGIIFDNVLNYDIEYKQGMFGEFDEHIVTKLEEKPSLDVYLKLRLVKEDRDKYFLTNLGIWFSNKREEYFPMLKIECARFKGTDAKVFLDQATFDGNIIDSIEKSMDFIKKNIKLGAKIGEVYRKNKWQYPFLALREVIVNAIVHRDYAIMGSDIKIAILMI